MISWRSKLLCPSEICIYTCDVQSSSIWHCTAEAEVFGLGTPPTPQPLPSPSPHIYALLSCMTCMWSQRTRRLAICFIRVRCGFDQVILSRAVTAWIQRWQLNVSFKYLGESWNKVKDLSTFGTNLTGLSKVGSLPLSSVFLEVWFSGGLDNTDMWPICGTKELSCSCFLPAVAKTVCCSLQNTAELCACYWVSWVHLGWGCSLFSTSSQKWEINGCYLS